MVETRWIVAYDIADPKRLYRVAKALAAVGARKQWSVFECWLTPWAFAQLQRQLRALIKSAEDSVRFYPLTGTGRNPPAPHAAGYFIV